MQYFIGIVPPEEYRNRIIEFQNNWGNHWISEAVEPHITLKAQGGLTPDKDWIAKVKDVCKDFNSFSISVDKPMFFGEDVLYLSAKSNELYDLHQNIVRQISPSDELIKKYFEMDDFTPHMTLGKTFYGLSKEELKKMDRLAEEELKPYPTFEVDFIRVYQEIKSQIYVKYLDIPLKK